MKIAISGKSGCGNTTVSKIISEKLNLKFINFTFRNLAQEKNMTLSEVLEKAKTDDFWDKETDRRQLMEARFSQNCVLGSRLAIWILAEAGFKAYLFADLETRVRRIQKREGGSFEEIKAFTEKRDGEDHERYMKTYNINNNEYSFADLIIDTGKYNADETANLIINAIKNK
ncbi:MAG: AAA family ATPase [Spirochaetaceae bacterium]|jgi:cytidylate kinase|nr:AAA family ATPase [Spirochaetaceae bacterium]